jgi:glycosyltransferase involved in cell wall biosynthesis
MARALSDKGHEVSVVSYGEKGGVDRDDGFIVERILRSQSLLKRYMSYMRAVRSRAHDVDFVYLQGPVSEGLPGTIGAMLAGKPTVMKVVGDYAWEMYMQDGKGDKVLLDEFVRLNVGAMRVSPIRKSIKIRFLEMVERWTAKRAKCVIVPSKYLKGIVEKWGVKSDRIHVIENAVEPLAFEGSEEDLRRKLGIQNRRVLFTVVRAVPWKHIDFIIRMLRDLPNDILLAIAGDGSSLKEWKSLSQSLGVSDRIRFLGRLDRTNLAEWFGVANLFVLPSGYEGFPHVIPEAASAGVVSLVSDKGGNPETQALLGNEFVRVLPYLDEEEWKRALTAEWPERRNPELPEALRFETMVKRTKKVLEEIL